MVRAATARFLAKHPGLPKRAKSAYPIQYWSHSSLVAFLRNPLAWYKRYVEKVYDTPRNPSAIIGVAGHLALQHFYAGIDKDGAIALGLEHIRKIPDFEIQWGKARSRTARKTKRAGVEREYLQAVAHYLEKPPKHRVVAVEYKATAQVSGLPLPIKAISDLVVESRAQPGALDIVDHKFVDNFSKDKHRKTLFIVQALFNYYTVRNTFGKPVRRFIVYECKKSKNVDGSPQLRKYVLDYATLSEEFAVFHRLINDATAEITRERVYLPNPSDMFEGENSFDIYRLQLLD